MMISGPARILFDEDGNAVMVQVEGTNYLLGVSDPNTSGVLCDLLKEVRVMRLMLAEALDSSMKIEDTE